MQARPKSQLEGFFNKKPVSTTPALAVVQTADKKESAAPAAAVSVSPASAPVKPKSQLDGFFNKPQSVTHFAPPSPKKKPEERSKFVLDDSFKGIGLGVGIAVGLIACLPTVAPTVVTYALYGLLAGSAVDAAIVGRQYCKRYGR